MNFPLKKGMQNFQQNEDPGNILHIEGKQTFFQREISNQEDMNSFFDDLDHLQLIIYQDVHQVNSR